MVYDTVVARAFSVELPRIGHGIEDDVVKLESSQLAYSHLKRKGARVELLTYTGNHKIGIKFLRKMKDMITSMPVFG